MEGINTKTGQKLLSQLIEDLESKINMYRQFTSAQTDQDTKDALAAWITMSSHLHLLIKDVK